jgi:hypothetical protein
MGVTPSSAPVESTDERLCSPAREMDRLQSPTKPREALLMKRLIAGFALCGLLGAGACTSYSAIAQGPAQDKVFVTKNTWYVVWSTNTMELCNFVGGKASNCVAVTED